MTTEEYNERKKTTLGLIKKAEALNPEFGEYLKTHFVIDDKNRTLMYTGAASVLESLMRNDVL